MATKLITVESPGKISVLGGIIGPIRNPFSTTTDVIINLINAGKIVYEVNPTNHNEKIRLTRLNVYKTNFSNLTKEAIESQKKIVENTIKAETVGQASVIVEPATASDTIDSNSGEGMVGTDIFHSNSKSSGKKKN